MRRRAARRSRRPGRAVPDRSLRAARDGRRRTPSCSPREQAIVEHLRRTARRSSPTLHEAAGGGYPGETVDALWDPRLEGAHHQRHVPRAARVHAAAGTAPAPARPQARARRSAAGGSRRRRRKAAGRSSASRADATGVADRMVDGARRSSCSRATAWSPARSPRPKGSPAASAPSTTCSRRWRMPAGSAAAISSAASARRSSRCRRRSICCARSREPPDEPEVVAARGDRSGESVRHDRCQWPADRRTGRRTPAAAPTRTVGSLVILVNGALGRLHQPRRAAAAGLPAGRRAGAIRRSDARSRGGSRRWRARARRPAHRRDQRRSRPPSIRSRRSWSTPASPVGDGLHDAATVASGVRWPIFGCDDDRNEDPCSASPDRPRRAHA